MRFLNLRKRTMSILEIDTSTIKDPKSLGNLYSTYMHQAEKVYELKFSESPDEFKTYYNYLDSEERGKFTALTDIETGVVVADWKGDRAIIDGDTFVFAPYFYRDNVWMYGACESMRFEMDLEESLYKVVE